MAIAEGIVAIKATVELAKLTTDLLNRPTFDVPDVRAKLHEMLIHAVNAQTALAEAQLETWELRQQLDTREALEALRADMEFVEDGTYWIRNSDVAQGRTIPYCNVCWSNNKAVPLGKVGDHNDAYYCQIDKSNYYTAAYRERQRKRTAQPGVRQGPPY